MESSVQFKVYYQDEIRRFSLKADQDLNYASLVQRIQTVFDIAPTLQLRLRWLDQDGDKIAFSTSSELSDAVQQLASQAVRVYVTARPEDTGSGGDGSFSQGEIYHPGVFCDGCNSSLRGYRFKCLMCPDYDLCLGCLNRDLHSQHQMLLIRRPGDGWSALGGWGGGWGGCRGGQRHCFRQQHHPHHHQQQEQQQPSADSGVSATSAASAESAARPAGEQQLIEHVTSAISTILAPLGIDASIQVVHQSSDAQVQAQSQQQQPSSEAVVKASLITETATSQVSVSPQLEESRSSCVQDAAQPVQMETSSAAFNDGNVGDFEFISRSPPPLPPPPPPHQQLQPQESLDPRIGRALEHMTAMGFSDDGGWLTRLLLAKDGDICAVLDAIRPAGGSSGGRV